MIFCYLRVHCCSETCRKEKVGADIFVSCDRTDRILESYPYGSGIHKIIRFFEFSMVLLTSESPSQKFFW